MKDLIFYYFFILFFYVIELYAFKLLLPVWNEDVFWLNITIRLICSIVSGIFIIRYLFSQTKNIYTKYIALSILNPISSSFLLKVLIFWFGTFDVVVLKLLADILNSLVLFFLLKKIS